MFFSPWNYINFQGDAEFILHHYLVYEVIWGSFETELFQNPDLALKVNINILKTDN